MTVRELITKLQTMPPDATVVYDCCSECVDMDEDQVRLVRKEDRKLCRRNGYYITYREEQWKGATPEFVTVCYFPGN